MRVALVYDRVNKIGGAERVLEALHEVWPDAPLFTSVYDPSGAPWATSYTVIPSFLNNIPLARSHHELFPWLTPFAFESFRFDDYDVVISITSAEAKDIITKPDTLHICYCLTPTRYLWSGLSEYRRRGGFGPIEGLAQAVYKKMLPTLRRWDSVASNRPDMYVGISQRVGKRIRKYYHNDRETVIYPPVDTDFFLPGGESGDYYLFVGRLVPYKRVDLLIKACNALKKPFVVIGDGTDRQYLETLAGPTVTFIRRRLTDKELLGYYQKCRAFLYSADEDFGIVAAEAQSSGKPVIFYKESGVAEIVKDGITGVAFEEQSVTAITSAIVKSEAMHFFPEAIRSHALQFGRERFKKTFGTFVKNAYNAYNTYHHL